ncbi:hypothetical protein OQA88_6506 [Cercophora sp. LCS_1]
MSEALLDEIEAINSIYGDSTLSLSSSSDEEPIYILSLPPAATTTGASLRLHFPPSYPDVPPAVLGIHSSGNSTKPGAAARDLLLFRNAIGDIYEPGQVCLFDAIEKVSETLSSDPPQSDALPQPEERQPTPSPDEITEEEPPWVVSPPLTELKSTFIARCCRVTSPAQAAGYVRHLLATDKRVRMATHNITAWRIRGQNGTAYQDCDDDGETAAGGRLLHLMQLMDLWDVMVVVTRWYGGQKLGPRRFALINGVARDAFVQAGLVEEKKKK